MVYMAMNIKNPEAHRLATELARRTGKSMTEAVTQALRDALARLRDGKDERLTLLLKDMRLRFTSGEGISAEDLYDSETGLPK